MNKDSSLTENCIVYNNSIIDECKEASSLYLRYSTEHEPNKQGCSQDIINVLSCTPKIVEDGQEVYELELEKPLKGKEFILRDKHHKKEYLANREFGVNLYDRNNNIVFIKFFEPDLPLDTGIRPNLELSFDLRILIMNQLALYEKHSMDIDCPRVEPQVETSTGMQYVKTFSHPNMPPLNEEQKQAAHMMLTTPFNMTKGPPGAGKSTMMALPVISYMAACKPVAVVTNTQVALERALSAIADICRSVGIDTGRIVKLGYVSQWYAEEYPETLESCEASEYLAKEEQDIFLLETALEYQSMQEKINQKSESLMLEMMMHDLSPNIEKVLDAEMKPHEQKSLHKMIEMKISTIKASVQNPELMTIIGDLNYRNFSDRFKDVMDYIGNLSEDSFDEPLSKEDEKKLRINNLEATSFKSRSELYEELIGTKYDHLNDEQIKQKIANIQIGIEAFKREYAKKKLSQAYLIGMTADSYNSRYKDSSLPVHHIFVDEGGYMPLIKVYGLCRKKIPLSIIGDPMQLPPVSEMSDAIKEDGEFEKVLLYDMSAFHLETLFTEGYEGLKRVYFEKLPPKISIPKVELTKTYRFGESLARILDRHVYKNGFTSANGESDFQLEYIDAVNEETPKHGRVNPAEAEAIKSLLASNDIGEDFVILTPYKNQVAHLKQTLKGLIRPNQAMSIHRSQGQEWETVIISVVDFMSGGSHGMWFTNSNNKISKGLEVVNTAVSRAKKRLILVGHRRFWIAQEKQLLGNLFQVAKAC